MFAWRAAPQLPISVPPKGLQIANAFFCLSSLRAPPPLSLRGKTTPCSCLSACLFCSSSEFSAILLLFSPSLASSYQPVRLCRYPAQHFTTRNKFILLNFSFSQKKNIRQHNHHKQKRLIPEPGSNPSRRRTSSGGRRHSRAGGRESRVISC